MFWIEFIVLMLIIVWGTRKGGSFLAMAGGIGMLIFVYIFRVTPSDPPITVILIMLAVITAACTMQATGGLDFMVQLAEKILRKNPKNITFVAPFVAYLFTFCCGTGHIVYSLLPVINEIALENGIRPERPISVSIISSQQANTGSPITAATVAIVGYMTIFEKVNLATIMLVAIPAALIGVLVAALSVYKKGLELEDDPEYQQRVADGLVKDFKKKVEGEKQVTKKAKISVAIFLVSMVVIAICGIFPALRPTFSDGTQLAMTSLIQIIMYVAAAIIVLVSKIDSNDILEVPLLKTGFFAVILAAGLCWLVNTFVGAQTNFITENLSALTNEHPWIYIIAVFLVGALTSSQASTTMIMIPIAIALNLPAYIIVGGWMACSSNYFIPDSSQCIAGLAFDTAGTTKIGKFIFNHSYMRPGLVCTIVSVLVATGIGYFVF